MATYAVTLNLLIWFDLCRDLTCFSGFAYPEKGPYLVCWFGFVCLTTGLLHSWFWFCFFPLSLQVGTSSVVYPAAMFAPQVSARGVPVAEFNMEATPATNRFR